MPRSSVEKEVLTMLQLPQERRGEMEPQLEKRRYPRRRAFYDAKYTIASGTYRDPIADVSAGGISIQTHRTVDHGERIRLRFPIIAFDQRPSITGTVVRSQEKGFAVAFDTPVLEAGFDDAGLSESQGA